MAVGRGSSGPLVWTLALGCLPNLRVAPAYCFLEVSSSSPVLDSLIYLGCCLNGLLSTEPLFTLPQTLLVSPEWPLSAPRSHCHPAGLHLQWPFFQTTYD